MKFLFLHTTSDLYGASKILLIITGILKKHGHEPIVVLSEDGKLVGELEKIGVRVHIIRLGILRRKYFNLPGLLNRMQVGFGAWNKLSDLIRKEKPDLIYSNTTGIVLGGFLAKKFKIPHIWHIHEIVEKPAAFTKVIGFLVNSMSDKVIVVSGAVKDHWSRSVSAEKLVRIYNGIDITPFQDKSSSLKQELSIPADSVLIGMIGRISQWKGQHYFLELAQLISAAHPECRFVIAGDVFPGNEHLETELKTQIEHSGIKEKINLLGFRKDIVNILNGLDIFVLPSTQPDPFPTVILEAMSAQKAIIATAQGGALEMLVNGASGIHIPLSDAERSFNLIKDLLSNSQRRAEMGHAAKTRVEEEFSFQAFEAKLLGILKLAVHSK